MQTRLLNTIGQIPGLTQFFHCYYDRYQNEADVLTINAMKEVFWKIRIVEIYATRVGWMVSRDDSEECFRERIKEDLAGFEKEYASKNWIFFNVN